MSRRILVWIPPVGWALCIWLASATSEGPRLLPLPHGADKALHGLVFGILVVLVYRALRASVGWHGFAPACLAVLATSLYGAADEAHQSFVPGRMVEFADWIADTAGAVLGIAFFSLWRKFPGAGRNTKENV